MKGVQKKEKSKKLKKGAIAGKPAKGSSAPGIAVPESNQLPERTQNPSGAGMLGKK